MLIELNSLSCPIFVEGMSRLGRDLFLGVPPWQSFAWVQSAIILSWVLVSWLDWLWEKREASGLPLLHVEAGGCGWSVQVGWPAFLACCFTVPSRFPLRAPSVGHCCRALVFCLGEHSTVCFDAALLEPAVTKQRMTLPSWEIRKDGPTQASTGRLFLLVLL